MPYLTEAQLLEANSVVFKSRLLESRKELASITIFLSHSHKDRAFASGFIKILATQDISVYVDWQDSDMPRVTNRETAEKIKTKIKELDLFLILATKNAMQSRWVPWEIGIADSSKPTSRIAIIPVVDASSVYLGNEYLQIYQEIEMGFLTETKMRKLAIFEPNKTQGSTVANWLKQYAK